MSKKYTLVTGGAGYIGAHMAGMLIKAGYNVVIFDNLSTGVRPWLPKGAQFVKGDLLKPGAIERVFKKFPISTVIHFAAKIVVPESMKKPKLYYRNNVGGTANLLSAMTRHKVRRIVFSSTAAVYGNPAKVPVTENAPTLPLNPYGTSKLMVEQILQDMAQAGSIDFIALRYFNVAGWDTRRAWPRKGRPVATHLISNVMKALHGEGPLIICGKDYQTHDGTGVRDFIHVIDLCQAHLLAIKALRKGIKNQVFNLGNGNGFSVLDIVKQSSSIAGRPVPYSIGPRRPGDAAIVVASSKKAKKILGWKPQYNLKAMLKSEWERKF